MYLYRNRKFFLNLLAIVLAFILGCTITLSLTNVDKHCDGSGHESAHLSERNIDDNNAIFLIVLILSAPKNIEQRTAIRDTWINLKPKVFDESDKFVQMNRLNYNENGFLQQDGIDEQNQQLNAFKEKLKQRKLNQNSGRKLELKILHYFAIGTASLSSFELSRISTENSLHKDLLLLNDFHDSYANLTQKLLRSIETLDNIVQFKYLLKTDDDTYVKLDYLAEELYDYDRAVSKKSFSLKTPRTELYWGYFNGRANLKRKGQWKEMNFNLCEHYLPYALGGGYVISRKLIGMLAANIYAFSSFVSEDISMGVWLSPFRNIYRKHDVRFDTGYLPRKCREYHIVLHKRSVSNMYDLYGGNLCTFKNADDTTINRPSEYFYDWKRSQTRCCDAIVPI